MAATTSDLLTEKTLFAPYSEKVFQNVLANITLRTEMKDYKLPWISNQLLTETAKRLHTMQLAYENLRQTLHWRKELPVRWTVRMRRNTTEKGSKNIPLVDIDIYAFYLFTAGTAPQMTELIGYNPDYYPRSLGRHPLTIPALTPEASSTVFTFLCRCVFIPCLHEANKELPYGLGYPPVPDLSCLMESYMHQCLHPDAVDELEQAEYSKEREQPKMGEKEGTS